MRVYFLLFLLMFAWPRSSHAYIDPGSGSYMFQFLIASLVAGAFAAKIYWQKIIGYFGRFRSRKKQDNK